MGGKGSQKGDTKKGKGHGQGQWELELDWEWVQVRAKVRQWPDEFKRDTHDDAVSEHNTNVGPGHSTIAVKWIQGKNLFR